MGNFNIRAYIAVILFAVGLAILGVIGIQQGWGLFRTQAPEADLNIDAFNSDALEDGALGLAGLDLWFNLLPPSSSEEGRRLIIELNEVDYIVRDNNPELDVVEVCLISAALTINYRDENGGDFFDMIDPESPLCVSPHPDDFLEDEEDFGGVMIDNTAYLQYPLESPITYELRSPDRIGLNFWYPFDRIYLEGLLDTYYVVTLSDDSIIEGSIEPFMAWDIQVSGSRLWNVDLNTDRITIAEDAPEAEYNFPGEYSLITLHLQRPLLYRLVLPFFVIMMVLLIGLVPMLGERDTLVDICAAMLFGIFGLKGILGPGEQMGQTILDLALIGLYVVLAFAAFLFFIDKVRSRASKTE